MFKKMIALSLFTISMGGLTAACGTADGDDACSSDNDCKGDRVCESGECVSPGTSPTNNNPTPNPDPNGTPNPDPNGTPNPDPNGTPNPDPNGTPDPEPTSGQVGDECFSEFDCESNFCRDEVCAVDDFGDMCGGNEDCAYGACLFRDGDDFGYCTATCESFSDCPSFWECGEVGNAAGTYCIQD